MELRSQRSYVSQRVVRPLQGFIHTEVLSGGVLLLAAIAALVWANSPWDEEYFDLFATVLSIDAGIVRIDEDLRHWINDGLMALFFFVVGLEIKRELWRGELAGFNRAVLPVVAAAGGMAVPAILFTAFNAGGDGSHGWGIPMATDIAFALGILALLGRRISSQVRLFLLALAIVDDIGAIIVIAVFYTSDIALDSLAIAVVLLGVVYLLIRFGVREANLYLILGVCIWVAMHESGVHATIAGVALGLLMPVDPFYSVKRFGESMTGLLARFREVETRQDTEAAEEYLGQMEELVQGTEAPVGRWERQLHPVTSFFVVPLFALANAGVVITGDSVEDAVSSPISQGVAFGLILGKPLGIFGATWLAVRLGVASLPRSMNWGHVLGVGLLGGVGFTVALFINELALDGPDLIEEGKLGILAGSLLSAVLGFSALWLSTSRRRPKTGGEPDAG
ncbi:MAG: Na+/H+ antiporter NhaA [Dehalococcoidia bacterium]